jgi:signal peptidase I
MDKARDAVTEAKQAPPRLPSTQRRSPLLLPGGIILLVLAVAVGAELLAGGAPTLPRVFYAPSTSMEPLIREGERFVVATAYYASHEPQRGDVVVYTHPRKADLIFVKRIVALAGDRIAVAEGRAILNGAPVSEPYIAAGDTGFGYNNMPEKTVPAGTVFVLGDNRANSVDSRDNDHGPVPVGNLIGRASYIVWSNDLGRVLQWIGTPARP